VDAETLRYTQIPKQHFYSILNYLNLAETKFGRRKGMVAATLRRLAQAALWVIPTEPAIFNKVGVVNNRAPYALDLTIVIMFHHRGVSLCCFQFSFYLAPSFGQSWDGLIYAREEASSADDGFGWLSVEATKARLAVVKSCSSKHDW